MSFPLEPRLGHYFRESINFSFLLGGYVYYTTILGYECFWMVFCLVVLISSALWRSMTLLRGRRRNKRINDVWTRGHASFHLVRSVAPKTICISLVEGVVKVGLTRAKGRLRDGRTRSRIRIRK